MNIQNSCLRRLTEHHKTRGKNMLQLQLAWSDEWLDDSNRPSTSGWTDGYSTWFWVTNKWKKHFLKIDLEHVVLHVCSSTTCMYYESVIVIVIVIILFIIFIFKCFWILMYLILVYIHICNMHTIVICCL